MPVGTDDSLPTVAPWAKVGRRTLLRPSASEGKRQMTDN